MDLISSTIIWIIIIGGISFAFRKKIAKIIKKVPLPTFLLFLIVGTIYSIVEENINCPPTGCSIIPYTIPFFFLFLLILLGIIRIFKIKKFWVGFLIFGVIGWAVEFILGSYKEILWSSPIVTISMSIWTMLTYSVIVIIPLTILLENDKNTHSAFTDVSRCPRTALRCSYDSVWIRSVLCASKN